MCRLLLVIRKCRIDSGGLFKVTGNHVHIVKLGSPTFQFFNVFMFCLNGVWLWNLFRFQCRVGYFKFQWITYWILLRLTAPPPTAADYCDERLFVCLLFRSISPELHVRSSPNFSGSVAIRFAFPVSWITPCLHISACGYRYSEWRHCVVERRLTGVGTGPADPAAIGPIIWLEFFLCSSAGSGACNAQLRCPRSNSYICYWVSMNFCTVACNFITRLLYKNSYWLNNIYVIANCSFFTVQTI